MRLADGTPPEAPQSSKRLLWLDYSRGFGISAIVIIHVQLGLQRAGLMGTTSVSELVDNIFGAIAIPTFFTLSGYFVVRSYQKRGLPAFTLDKVKTLIYPYVLWGVIYTVLQSGLSGYTNHQSSLAEMWRLIYKPPFHFWFLYSLFIFFVGYAILLRLKFNPWIIFLLALILYTSHHYAGLGNWGILYLVRRYVLFFAFGAVAAELKLIHRLNEAKTPQIAVGAIIAACGVVYFERFDAHSVYLQRPLIGAMGVVMIFSSSILLHRYGVLTFVEHLGQRSLEIYIAHVLTAAGARIIMSNALGIESLLIQVPVGIAAGLYGPLVLAHITDRIGFHYLFSLKDRTPKLAPAPAVRQPAT